MDLLHTIVLALLQGLTEFLPISSSAHLILPSQVLGWPDQGLAFDVAVHVGTLGAVLVFFRRDVGNMIRAWAVSLAGGGSSEDSRLAWWVIVATIPASVAGFAGNDLVEENLRATWVIAAATIGFGVVIFVADQMKHDRRLASLTLKDTILIGLAQMLALIPGTSRSGITIAAALALGMKRTDAARFSFLLSIPIIGAAGALKLWECVAGKVAVDWQMLIVGTGVAFASAYLCIAWFLKIVERIGLTPFVIYRLALGLLLFIFFV